MEAVSGGKRVRKRMTLHSKINVFVVLIVGIVLMLVTGTLSFLIINWQFEDKGQDALTLTKTIGNMPVVIEAFHQPNPAATIQPIMEEVRKTIARILLILSTQWSGADATKKQTRGVCLLSVSHVITG